MARRRFRLGIVAACIVLAAILWGFVTLTRYYETDVRVPLLVEPPPNHALLSTIPEEIIVRVRGTGLQILNLLYLSQTSECSINLREVQGTSQGVYTIERDQFIRGISSPEAVRILNISPATVVIATGDVFEKTVPVRLTTSIAPRSGFTIVGQPTAEPASVVLRGTRSVVEGLNEWPSLKYSAEDAYGPIDDVVGMSDSLKTLLNVVPPRVRVHADIQQLVTVTIADIPVTVTGSPGALVIPSRFAVTVRTGVNEAALLSPSDFRVLVSPDPSGYAHTMAIVPQNVQLVGVSPRWVRTISMASP